MHLKQNNIFSLFAEGCWWRGRGIRAKVGRGGEQCVREDMKLLGLQHSEWAIFKDMWRDLIWGKRLTLA